MSVFTTISVRNETKEELDAFIEFFAKAIAKFSKKPIKKISYDDVIRFLLKNVKVNPEIVEKMRKLEAQTAQAY